MTLHPEELEILAKSKLRGPMPSRERLERGIDTGWILDGNSFTKENDAGAYWISDGTIWGPKNSGLYKVDKEGRILMKGKETGFYIEEGRVYGPSPNLPWMK